MAPPFLLQTGKRLAAVLGASALGLGAFALPAAAQPPAPIEAAYDLAGPVEAGGETRHGGFTIIFGEDFEPGVHTVSFDLAVDAPEGTFRFEGEGLDPRCEGDDAANRLSCTQEEAGSDVFFDFDFGAAEGAEAGLYPYAVTLFVDGEQADASSGEIEVVPAEGAEADSSAWPYLHGDAVFTDVEPGSTVEVQPEFLQEWAFPDDAAAVIVTFSEPEYPFNEGRGADASAGYDNCVDRYFDAPGVTCVVTDYEDAPGTVFTPAVPVHYAVSDTAPGPVDVCVCYYSAYVVNAAELDERFGDVSWDAGSGNLFGLRVVNEPESEFEDSTVGEIVIKTADNPWDLAVDDVNVKGDKGAEKTAKVEVTNEGPADAYNFFDGPGSYALLGKLPTGLDLVSIDEDGWICLEKADWANYLPGEDAADLAALDFVCLFEEIAVDQTRTLPVHVKITADGSHSDGTLEISALDNDGYPGVLEADATDNTARFSVNADGSGQLTKTGSSLILVIGVAAAILIAGVLLFVLGRRRRATGAADEAGEK